MFRSHVHERSQDPDPPKKRPKTRARRPKKPRARARRPKKPSVIEEGCEEIYFNSKSTEYIKLADGTMAPICKLSNLFGGAEFEYMASRFTQHQVTGLFDMLENCDRETFIRWLKKLQPGKEWNPAKETHWFHKRGPHPHDWEPIRGILAQLLGTMVRNTQTAKTRRRVVAKELGLESIIFEEELTPEDKQAWMKVCLDHKYIPGSEFRDILLATGDAVLHERPMRGKPNAWSYKEGKGGGDWLGQLLMQLRAEIRVN